MKRLIPLLALHAALCLSPICSADRAKLPPVVAPIKPRPVLVIVPWTAIVISVNAIGRLSVAELMPKPLEKTP